MRNAIVYLVRGHEASIASLERSLALLKRNFLPWSPADVLVFHEDNLKPEQLEGRTAGLAVKTALVDFSAVPPEMANLPPGQRGYRHMCHFFANDIFLRPELADYDYYMRLDDDSFILSPLTFNVFARMRGGRAPLRLSRDPQGPSPRLRRTGRRGRAAFRRISARGEVQAAATLQVLLHELRNLRPRVVSRPGMAVVFRGNRPGARHLEIPLGRCADPLLRRDEQPAGSRPQPRRDALPPPRRMASGAPSPNLCRGNSPLLDNGKDPASRKTWKCGIMCAV